MPQTNFERVLAGVTLAGICALALLLVVNWGTMRGGGSPSEPAGAARAEAKSEPVPVASTSPTVPSSRKPSPPPKPVAPPPALSIAAVGGPSWLEVRSGDAAGEQLYFGMLAEGEEQMFRRLPVWIRLGAPESVAVQLGDSSVEALSEFIASAEGVTAPAADE